MRPSDGALHRKVLAELEAEPSLREEEIGIAVKDGVVTLTGRVQSYDHKFAAELSAARVSGVEAVADELKVQQPGLPRTLADAEIAHAVTNHLKWHLHFRDRTVKVKVEHGWVTLAGDLDSLAQKESAEREVAQLSGVKGVINLLDIRVTSWAEQVQSKIEAAILNRAQLDQKAIRVRAEDGVVVLSGQVSSPTLEREIVKAAQSAPGVTEVVDRLEVSTAS